MTKRRHRTFWRTVPSRVGFAIYQFRTWPRRWLRAWFIAHVDERVVVRDMPVIIDSDDASHRERVCADLSEALEKLAAWAPRLRRRLNAEVRQIRIQPGKAAAYFHPGTIVIPLHAFDDTDIDGVASLIIHEAVHARLEARGIRYWPHLRSRIERRCLREQLAFLTSRGRTDLVDYFEEYLRRTYSHD